MSDACRLVHADTGEVIVERLEIADTWWSRFRGLQFRAPLAAGTGLLLVPCASVHTCFAFPIDVVLLDRAGRVLAIRPGVRPWRCVLPVAGAYATLEVPAGSASLRLNDLVRVEAGTNSPKYSFFSDRAS